MQFWFLHRHQGVVEGQVRVQSGPCLPPCVDRLDERSIPLARLKVGAVECSVALEETQVCRYTSSL